MNVKGLVVGNRCKWFIVVNCGQAALANGWAGIAAETFNSLLQAQPTAEVHGVSTTSSNPPWGLGVAIIGIRGC